MVRGNPRDKDEADSILDNLVRQTFLFLSKNPNHVARQQPEAYQVSNEYDKELTAELVKAGVLSDGYVAVLSGTPTQASDKFNGGRYRLAVHTIRGKNPWEGKRVNVNLLVNLTPGTTPGIENAVGGYSVGQPLTVIFEEVPEIREVWTGETRPIEIVKSPLPARSAVPDDILAYLPGKTPLDSSGKPIPASYFEGARSRIPSHPEGTAYQVVQNNQVRCFFPKN